MDLSEKIKNYELMPKLKRSERIARSKYLSEIIADSTNAELTNINKIIKTSDLEVLNLSETDEDRLHYLRVGGDTPDAWKNHK